MRFRHWVQAVLILVALGTASACGDDDDGERALHPEGVGNYCEQDADCPTGTCYIGPGGGYCTAPCSGEGSIDGCPIDTVCKPIQGGPERCLLICGSVSTCDEHIVSSGVLPERQLVRPRCGHDSSGV